MRKGRDSEMANEKRQMINGKFDLGLALDDRFSICHLIFDIGLNPNS